MQENFLYEKESRLIYDACHKIWKEFGGAFKESVVDKALSVALRQQGLFIEDQKRIELFYMNQKVGTYIIDKVVNKKIIIELKCKPFLHKDDITQFWRY